jgi:GDP-mannose transporter
MTNWGRVYYTNFLSAAALVAVFPFCSGEHKFLAAHEFTPPQIMLLLLSCAVGVCMSHASYLMRSNVSATASVVVGIVCKIGSVLINLCIWDQHASPIQLMFLTMGLAGGSLFQQAPVRNRKQQEGGDEKQPLLDPEEAVKQQQPLRISLSGGSANKREGRVSGHIAGSEQA